MEARKMRASLMALALAAGVLAGQVAIGLSHPAMTTPEMQVTGPDGTPTIRLESTLRNDPAFQKQVKEEKQRLRAAQGPIAAAEPQIKFAQRRLEKFEALARRKEFHFNLIADFRQYAKNAGRELRYAYFLGNREEALQLVERLKKTLEEFPRIRKTYRPALDVKCKWKLRKFDFRKSFSKGYVEGSGQSYG